MLSIGSIEENWSFPFPPPSGSHIRQLTIEKENSGSYSCVPAIVTQMTYLLSFLFLCLVSWYAPAKELKIFLLTGQPIPWSREGDPFSEIVEEV